MELKAGIVPNKIGLIGSYDNNFLACHVDPLLTDVNIDLSNIYLNTCQGNPEHFKKVAEGQMTIKYFSNGFTLLIGDEICYRVYYTKINCNALHLEPVTTTIGSVYYVELVHPNLLSLINSLTHKSQIDELFLLPIRSVVINVHYTGGLCKCQS